MSITIRLARIGRKNLTAYKIVVANTKSKRNGMSLDIVGSFNPSEKPQFLTIDKDKVKMWTERGALMTDGVKNLIAGKYEYKFYPSAKKVKREQKKLAEQAAKSTEA